MLNNKKIFKYSEIENKGSFFIISSEVYKNGLTESLTNVGVLREQIWNEHKPELLMEITNDILDWKKYTKKNQKFYRCHENLDRCFIIGNGPSLRIDDLNMLQDEITFAANSIYGIYDKTNWRPTYYCVFDSIGYEYTMNTKENMKKLTSNCKALFTSVLGKGFQFRDDEEFQNINYAYCMVKTYNDSKLPYFSENCCDMVYTSGVVAYIMLQLAIYMGFKKIYLVGMDCSYAYEIRDGVVVEGIKNDHMKELEVTEEKLHEAVKKKYGYKSFVDMDKQMAGYQAAQNYAKDHNIKIYNATRGGILEIFERVKLDEVI